MSHESRPDLLMFGHGLSGSREDARYLIKYKNNLVGRQFKFIQQLAVFHLRRDMCNDLVFDLWKATGELGALLWYPIINNMEQYLADLNVLIANVLDIWAKIDANRIIDKMKLHVLTHLPEDVQRFGPPGLYIVEGFEGWNRIWRLCSILSNHHSPSRDIAIKLCKVERIKHLLSGGFWQDKSSKAYVQAGKAVWGMFDSDKKLRRRLGWNQAPGLAPGKFASRLNRSVKFIPAKKQPKNCTWDELFDSGTIPPPCPDGIAVDECLSMGESIVATSGDVCRVGSWVFYRSTYAETYVSENGEESVRHRTMMGRIFKIAASKARVEHVIMEVFDILESRDHRYGMPSMHASTDQRYQAIPPSNVSFLFNAQHDCEGGECGYEVDEVSTQNGQPTRRARIERKIMHSTHDKYFINLHALHNAWRLREVLPRNLTEPVPYVDNREEFHHEMARKLQKANPKKRARAKEKAKDTRERKKRVVDSTGGIEDVQSEYEVFPAL
ncbi:hypothetical protein BJ322DRAFT_1167229 [Thelephora terrestris]|uniref:Uncharacterized protein n=1 Tax=Thelephora terrestris TaxID=56493 RepID=A0A9P6L240_9AGAM|nr:hypothetical protein BJ322DRAFT_1167229 [Thelephora terrestris]